VILVAEVCSRAGRSPASGGGDIGAAASADPGLRIGGKFGEAESRNS
jgi:hypothetical protein